MESIQNAVFNAIEYTGWLAPILFILLHLLRPLLFLPVVLVCMAGGYFFGFWAGTVYSIIGLTLMSAVFYWIVNRFPGFQQRVAKMKRKVFQDREMTLVQVMILRMMPFVHFHLLSLYLIEMTQNFRNYMYFSTAGIILPSIMFTGFGHILMELSWGYALIIIALLGLLFVYIGRREKEEGTPLEKQA
ncbi:TVP38/TMEM64 family protein [Alkalicoccus halolimnae]|uniref:TVP38/TMEM64 family membrane protein n=1 Tax=Alkalicoccus halolimnae TaxID=1667239 RepID=A0A5C7F524_9BACI|nr:VTT domain-containing protein [Alkalicoccus halolimnae]TXF85761.1 TVP38/TMEM64 family protein [Alkalicoccus halolimnae]